MSNNVYYCNDFVSNHHPGTIIIVAKTIEDARRMMHDKLLAAGIAQEQYHGPTLHLLDTNTTAAHLIDDGDY